MICINLSLSRFMEFFVPSNNIHESQFSKIFLNEMTESRGQLAARMV